MFGNLSHLSKLSDGECRAITHENRTGEKGKGGMAEGGQLGTTRKSSACKNLFRKGEVFEMADINGMGVIRHMWITVTDRTEKYYYVLRNLIIRIYWDNETVPSVEAPLGDFFCNGFGERVVVNSIPIVVNPTGAMNCYFPMPFRKGARITITNDHQEDIGGFFYQVNYELCHVDDDEAYFHALYHRENPTTLKKDYTVVRDIKGRGKFVGMYMGIATLSRYWWGEGEVKMFVDGDKEFPTICGTGSEDYFGGAWGFRETLPDGKQKYVTYNTPFLGYPLCKSTDSFCPDDWPEAVVPMHAFYRWHIMDPIIFNRDLTITIQNIGVSYEGLFERADDMCSVAYWYQTEPHTPFPAMDDRDARRPR